MLKKVFLLTIAIYLVSQIAYAAENESVLSPVTQKELVPFDSASTEKANELSQEQANPEQPAANAAPTAPKAPDAPTAPQGNTKKSAQTEGVRAGDIYVSCKDYFQNSFNNKENISKRATCNGYFFGVGSTLLTLATYNINTNICLPADVTTHQVIQTFLDWGKANTDKLSIQAADATLRALGARFPCKKE